MRKWIHTHKIFNWSTLFLMTCLACGYGHAVVMSTPGFMYGKVYGYMGSQQCYYHNWKWIKIFRNFETKIKIFTNVRSWIMIEIWLFYWSAYFSMALVNFRLCYIFPFIILHFPANRLNEDILHIDKFVSCSRIHMTVHNGNCRLTKPIYSLQFTFVQDAILVWKDPCRDHIN